MNDLISRSKALEAMWKALYEYEEKTEKQFQESDELDVSDWIMIDRLWVQNGHNLCVGVIASMPSAEPEIIQCKDCKWFVDNDPDNAQGMCNNAKGWVVATSYDFGCIYAERKDNG